MLENPYSAPEGNNERTPPATKRFLTGRRVIEWCGVAIFLGVIVLMLLPAVRRAGPIARRTQCKNNLRQIMLALQLYEQTYHTFPPPFTVDAKGQPLHSWRTLLLPYLDQALLYNQIDLSKPWNSPANAEAYQTFVPAYACSATALDRGMTTYQAIVGPEAFFDPVKPRTLRDFRDGIGDTLAIAEVNPELSVHWMSPFDHGKEFLLTLRPKTKLQHAGGTHVAIGDTSVRFISESVNLNTRRALITIAGDDTIGNW